jgi:hypothetical protein
MLFLTLVHLSVSPAGNAANPTTAFGSVMRKEYQMFTTVS